VKHIKPFNESKENLKEELKYFCETSLAYLLDDGYDISITLRDNQHIIITLGLKAQENTWLQDYDTFNWDDVKDHYIPFIQMLVRRYELLDYSTGNFAFNTKRGIFYLSVDQIINDEVSQVFDCPIWGINLKINK